MWKSIWDVGQNLHLWKPVLCRQLSWQDLSELEKNILLSASELLDSYYRERIIGKVGLASVLKHNNNYKIVELPYTFYCHTLLCNYGMVGIKMLCISMPFHSSDFITFYFSTHSLSYQTCFTKLLNCITLRKPLVKEDDLFIHRRNGLEFQLITFHGRILKENVKENVHRKWSNATGFTM